MTKPRRGRDRAAELTELEWAYLNDGVPDDAAPSSELWGLKTDTAEFAPTGRSGRELWEAYRAEVLEHWTNQRPGTRPALWWRYDAPEPRQRVGGIGTPCHERLAHALRLAKGVPVDWITAAELETYARLRHWLEVPAVDPKNPPTFESEAAYLRRLGLLGKEEAKRLRPAAYQPEAIAMGACDPV